MELLKQIIALITEYLKAKNAKTEAAVTQEQQVQTNVVSQVQASTAQAQIETLTQANEALVVSQTAHAQEKIEEEKKPIDEQIDDQMGGTW